MLDDTSYRMLVAKGTIVYEANSKVNYRLMIDNIISDLKSGKIQSHQRHNAKRFYENYLKGFLSNENLQKLEDSAIESATTELPNLSQLEELTTKDEVQESSTVDLQDQESCFVPDEEISYVIEEIKRSNSSNGIAMQNIESVQNTTNILGNPMIHDTNLRGFKLLETSRSNKENMRVFTAGILAVVVALVAAFPFKYWSCNRKSKGHSSSKEETPSSDLLSAITLESGANSIS